MMSVLEQTVRIVEAFIARVGLPPHGITPLVQEIHGTLLALAVTERAALEPDFSREGNTLQRSGVRPDGGEPGREPLDEARATPAVPIAQAVSHDSITCLICGKAAKTLKGHLTRTHELEVEAYRNLFGLPRDFPMVAPAYSEKRRQLAVDSGLGDKMREERRREDGRSVRTQTEEEDQTGGLFHRAV